MKHSSKIISVVVLAVLLFVFGICAVGQGEARAQGDSIGSFIANIISALKLEIKNYNPPAKLPSLGIDPRSLRQERENIPPGGSMGPGGGSSGRGYICLAKDTLIDTPAGPVPVDKLRQGMAVWTADDTGNRVVAVVLKATVTPVPSYLQVVKVILNDGRVVTASSGHPTAMGRALGEYRAGDTLDGALVVAVEPVGYEYGVTYDLLPSGTTGLYWANEVLLKSTLATD